MAEHDATTLAFVRTPAGVVKVPAGQRVPHDALPGELDRLARAGAVREVEADEPPPPPAPDPAGGDLVEPVGDDAAEPTGDDAAKPRGRRTRKSDED